MRSVTMMNQVPTLPALGERCSVLDTVSKRARTPLRSPICVRGQKCLLVDNARDEIASDMCESSVTSKSHGRVCKLIDLVLSSSIEDTVRVVDETDALRTLVSSTRPLNYDTKKMSCSQDSRPRQRAVRHAAEPGHRAGHAHQRARLERARRARPEAQR